MTFPRRATLTLAALLSAVPAIASAANVWTASALEKLRPQEAARTDRSASLTAAKNEFEAFQVVVTGPASGVSVSATALQGAGTVPAPRLFREALIDLQQPSAADGATGAFPDALIPDVDDVVGEKRNAFPFDVPAGESRAVWVELHVPQDATAGAYTGSVTVHAADGDAQIPVQLTVWDFALPSTSSLKSFFALYYGDLPAQHGVSGDALSTLRARYAQLGLDHRISVSGFDDGNTDLNHFAQFYGPLIDGTAPTQLAAARLTSVEFLGSRTTADYAAWASFFKARGWFDRLFDYTCDEPPQTCAWSDISARNAMLKAADSAFRSLVTTTVQDATSNGVLSSIDILTPVVNWMDDKPGAGQYSGPQATQYAGFLGQGSPKELWMYQSCMSHGCGGTNSYFTGWPSYMIDTASLRSRAMEWLSFQWGVTGELYWETTWAYGFGDPWVNQYQFSGNGDGTLFYPGTPARIGGQTDIPIASLRLKMLRDGMQDFEYLKALSDAGDPGLAQQLAATLFPDAWTEPSLSDLLSARDQIAQRILQLTGNSGTGTGTTSTASASSAPAATTTVPAASAPSSTPQVGTPDAAVPGSSMPPDAGPTASTPASAAAGGGTIAANGPSSGQLYAANGSGCSTGEGAGSYALSLVPVLLYTAARRRRLR